MAEKKQRQVLISRSAANGIISYSKALHPNEGILILQGKVTKERIIIEGLVILPFDNSYIGSAHSHPGGSNRPSLEDLNRGFYGAVSIIIAHPYEDSTIGAYDRDGNKLEIKITNS